MKIKYLLSGRVLSDINHFRKLMDSWPDNIKFPDVVEDLKNINIDDIVITTGYLGQSAELINNHNPNKVFILDNAIFTVKGITNFRLLNGNLKTLIKNYPLQEQLYKGFYRKNLLSKFSEFKFDSYDNNLKQTLKIPEKSNIIEFPWSIPIKKIIQTKDKEAINLYNNNKRIFLNGVIFRELSNYYSNWRSLKSLNKWLIQNNVIGVSNLNTRNFPPLLERNRV